MIEAIIRVLLRGAAGTAQKVRRGLWWLTRSRPPGVHSVPVTPHGTIVLVRLRYAPGWRLPGGGRGPAEDPRRAMLRELREEIGLLAHGAIETVRAPDGAPGFEQEVGALFIVREVEYRPRWSLEIEAVIEAAPDRLPDDLAEPARQALAIALPMIRQAPRPN